MIRFALYALAALAALTFAAPDSRAADGEQALDRAEVVIAGQRADAIEQRIVEVARDYAVNYELNARGDSADDRPATAAERSYFAV